jgi:hypothetical protein
MSQLVQPKLTVPGQIRSSKWLAPVVIVLVAAALMAVALIDGNDKPANVAVDQPQSLEQALRPGGGPEETGVAAAIAPRPMSASLESRIAAAVAAGYDDQTPTPVESPVESRIAAAVAAGAESTSSQSETHTPVPIGPLGRK